MHEARDRLDLAQEPFTPDRRSLVGLDDLDGDRPAMAHVPAEIDDRHAAFAEHTHDGIRANLPDRNR